MELYFLISALLGLYVAWNIGANDVANSMATAVGARAITFKQAIFIASILNFIGATFIGSHVTETVKKGIVDIGLLQNTHLAIIGFLSALLSAGIWITLSTWKSLPISTTHSIVGALIGFGLISGGVKTIHWIKVGEIVLSWVISPLFAGILSFSIFKLLMKKVLLSKNRRKSLQFFTPLSIVSAISIIFFSFVFKTPLGKKMGDKAYLMIIPAILTMVFLWVWIRKYTKHRARVEAVFRKLQITTSCYMALSHGSNDVANAIGPVASVYSLLKFKEIGTQVPVPLWLLAIGGIGIMLGISTWGYRVINTVGKRITRLSNTRGFTIDFSAATSILLASKAGMPVSTTHAVIGAIVGVGLAKGLGAVDLGVLKQILISWLLTLPATIITTMVLYLAGVKIFNFF